MTFLLIYPQMQKFIEIFSIFVTDVLWPPLHMRFREGVVTTLYSPDHANFWTVHGFQVTT